MIKQLRASGGIWFCLGGNNFIADPGPGALVRALKSRPRLNPSELDFIFLSHKHLDHSCDINLMIEAMTNGGFNRKGTVYAPGDALSGDPVIFRYILKYPEKIEVLKEGGVYNTGGLSFKVPVRHRHSVETYGFKMECQGLPAIAYLPDTGYFEGLTEGYAGSEILIINTVIYEKLDGLGHLSLPDAEKIIKAIKPKKAILTHFGITMLKNRIWEKGEEISARTGTDVVIAGDGMRLDLDPEDSKG